MRIEWTTSLRRRRVRTGLGVALLALGLCCLLVYTRPTLVHFTSQWVCSCGDLPAGAIVADSRGRLGNNLAEYATIYALGIRYNVTALATEGLLHTMGAVFPFTALPVVGDCCAAAFQPITADKFEAMTIAERRESRWKIDYYPHRIRLFWYYRKGLLREFRFRRDLTDHADALLRRVAGGREHATFVGVHVRRTDYAKHLHAVFGGQPLNESFYLSALKLCRQRYHQPVFIVTSDDLQWCREHLSAGDVHILGDPQTGPAGAARDLALLAACNHSVFDYGTFGFFAAFLAGGDLILADGYSEKEHEVVEELREGRINATFIDGSGKLLQKCVHCL